MLDDVKVYSLYTLASELFSISNRRRNPYIKSRLITGRHCIRLNMATGFIAVRQQVRIISVGVWAAPKEPLSRANKVKRLASGYRTTNNNIAAIDFGTTSVSLAYTTRGDKEVNTLVLNSENQDTRVPNAILLRKEGASLKMLSFGQEARTNYTRMRPNDRNNHVYFERIKMLMKREEVNILL